MEVNRYLDDRLSSSEPSRSVDGFLPHPTVPEEADDKPFHMWCHLKYLACGRDRFLRLLNGACQRKLSLGAGSVVCRRSQRMFVWAYALEGLC
jgi:hypothetical protein